jgi:flagellar motor switch/type III secretory pathway protein FliN
MSDTPALSVEPIETVIEQVQSPAVSSRFDAFFSIPVDLEIVVASVKMPVAKLMDIQVGTEIDLGHTAGTEVSLVVNGSVIAFGHLFLMDPKTRQVGVKISRLANAGGA